MIAIGLRDVSGRVFWTLEHLDGPTARKAYDMGWKYGGTTTDANGAKWHWLWARGECSPGLPGVGE